jgi:hypothetical protein
MTINTSIYGHWSRWPVVGGGGRKGKGVDHNLENEVNVCEDSKCAPMNMDSVEIHVDVGEVFYSRHALGEWRSEGYFGSILEFYHTRLLCIKCIIIAHHHELVRL